MDRWEERFECTSALSYDPRTLFIPVGKFIFFSLSSIIVSVIVFIVIDVMIEIFVIIRLRLGVLVSPSIRDTLLYREVVSPYVIDVH